MGMENSKLCTVNSKVRQDTKLLKTNLNEEPRLIIKSEKKIYIKKKTGITFADENNRKSLSQPGSPGIKTPVENVSIFYAETKEGSTKNVADLTFESSHPHKTPKSADRSRIGEINMCIDISGSKVNGSKAVEEEYNYESPSFTTPQLQPITDRSHEPLINLSSISSIPKQNFIETEPNIFESNFISSSLATNENIEKHPCLKRQELKDLMKQKKDLKKYTKHFEKKVENLQNDVEDLTLTKMDLQKELETLCQSVEYLQQDKNFHEDEYNNLLEKNKILENEIQDSLHMIAKKIPGAKNLTPEKFHNLASLLQVPADFFFKCLNKTLKLIFQGSYDSDTDLKEGAGMLLYPSGSLFYEGQFRQDKVYGNIVIFYYDDPKMEEVDANKKPPQLAKICGVEENLIDSMNGWLVMYYENGSKMFDGELSNGYTNGECQEFYQNGVKKFTGNYVNGFKHGMGKEFFDTGNSENLEVVQFSGEYMNGFKNGSFTEYYINGQKKYTGSFENDLKHGDGEYYHESGQVVYESKNPIRWENDEINGTVVNWYNSDGSLVADHLNFQNGKVVGSTRDCYLYFQNGKNWMFRNAFYNDNGKIHRESKFDLAEYRDLIDIKKEKYGEQYFQTWKSPNNLFKFIGTFKNGKKHGFGLYAFGTQILFEGQWQDDLPTKNHESINGLEKNWVQFLAPRLESSKEDLTNYPHFRGTIIRDENNGWLFGECEIYKIGKTSTNARLYKGKYRAPTLDSIILQTLDMELSDYKEILPKNNYQV